MYISENVWPAFYLIMIVVWLVGKRRRRSTDWLTRAVFLLSADVKSTFSADRGTPLVRFMSVGFQMRMSGQFVTFLFLKKTAFEMHMGCNFQLIVGVLPHVIDDANKGSVLYVCDQYSMSTEA